MNLAFLHPEVIKGVLEKIPVVDLIPVAYDAYQKMTPDEKAEFMKNALIIGAKVGASV